jgi:hypothetical protein
MTHTYAADDFAIIRARLEELRRQQTGMSPGTGGRSEMAPGPHRGDKSGAVQLEDRRIPHSAARKLSG